MDLSMPLLFVHCRGDRVRRLFIFARRCTSAHFSTLQSKPNGTQGSRPVKANSANDSKQKIERREISVLETFACHGSCQLNSLFSNLLPIGFFNFPFLFFWTHKCCRFALVVSFAFASDMFRIIASWLLGTDPPKEEGGSNPSNDPVVPPPPPPVTLPPLPRDSILILPDSILAHIFLFASLRDIPKCMRTCLRFHTVLSNNAFWEFKCMIETALDSRTDEERSRQIAQMTWPSVVETSTPLSPLTFSLLIFSDLCS